MPSILHINCTRRGVNEAVQAASLDFTAMAVATSRFTCTSSIGPMLLVSTNLDSTLVKASDAMPQKSAAAAIVGAKRTERIVASTWSVFSNARLITSETVVDLVSTSVNASTGVPG